MSDRPRQRQSWWGRLCALLRPEPTFGLVSLGAPPPTPVPSGAPFTDYDDTPARS